MRCARGGIYNEDINEGLYILFLNKLFFYIALNLLEIV